jgi:hypothetical protein
MKIPAHRAIGIASGNQVNGRTAYNVWILAGVALFWPALLFCNEIGKR